MSRKSDEKGKKRSRKSVEDSDRDGNKINDFSKSSQESAHKHSKLDSLPVVTCTSDENSDDISANFAQAGGYSTKLNGVDITIQGDDIDAFKNPITEFSQSNFNSDLQSYCNRFKSTTPIQAFSCKCILARRDIIGIAQTGSGKTAAFSLPVLNLLMKKQSSSLKFLILCPTRELCIQTFSVFEEMYSFTKILSVCVYGGVSKSDQLKQLKKKPQIVVATPGRLNDFLDSNEIDLSHVSYVVLDEADRMLDMGFEPEVRKILSKVPTKRQTLMFSATWPSHVQKLSLEFLANPISLVIGARELTANSQISQSVEVMDDNRNKNARLLEILSKFGKMNHKIIVFVLYKAEASKVETLLNDHGFYAVSIHGDKNQSSRTEAFESFRSGKCNILVATDVAARGLDIPNVELVINYTFPLTIEDYIHRIGRTGRGQKSGISRTFFTPADKAHSGELINVLKKAGQDVPSELLRFGTTIKKKEHKEYGAFYKEIDPFVKGAHVKFDD